MSNVIEEQNDMHEMWQEVYPSDRHVHPGRDDRKSTASLGKQDEQKGNGNYVFVLWRHYRGCIQGDHFIMATEGVLPTRGR